MAFTGVLNLFGSHSSQELNDCLSLDAQFIFDRENKTPSGLPKFLELEWLLWRAVVACGTPASLNLRDAEVPIKTYADTITAGIPRWHPIEVVSAAAIMNTATEQCLSVLQRR